MRPKWRATYRLQLTPEFGFDSAARLVPYLERLGISHLYLSPILEARKGSAHGYDVTDPRVVRSELGGEAAFRAMCDAAHARGLGILVDIVPNHMAASLESEPFRDVLCKGESSPFASWFDVEWDRHGSDRRIVLPWLGDSSAPRFVRGERGIELDVGGERLPVRGAFALPVTQDEIAAALAAQAYRLVPWREAVGQRNYRRYLDLDHLIGVLVEDEAVFTATHAKILELAGLHYIDGLRIDHLDGLADPRKYLATLRAQLPDDCAIFVEQIGTQKSAPEVGATGYDFLAATTNALLPAEMASVMTRVFAERANPNTGDSNLLNPLCRLVAQSLLRDELDATLRELAEHFPKATSDELERAVIDLCAFETRDEVALRIRTSSRASRFVRYVRSKAIEDTFFWREVSVLAQRELGFSAVPNGDSAGALSTVIESRAKDSSPSLNTTSTHDTKRSEDVRARLIALASRPLVLASIVDASRREFEDRNGAALEFEDAWLTLSELIGAWPEFAELVPGEFISRMELHLAKAARESKRRSNWHEPDLEYERRLSDYARFVAQGASEPNPWRSDFSKLRADVAREGRRLSLAQVVLKCAAPGIADFYQGGECMILSLVDPDNRRPVDFLRNLETLDSLERMRSAMPRNALLDVLVNDASFDRLKLFVTTECLAARCEHERESADLAVDFHVDTEISSVIAVTRTTPRGGSMAIVNRGDSAIASETSATIRLPGGAKRLWRDRFTHRAYDGDRDHRVEEVTHPLGVAWLEWKAN